jgi:hypothetical protein
MKNLNEEILLGLLRIESKLDVINYQLKTILKKENTMSAEFDALKAAVAANHDIEASGVQAILGLMAQLQTAINSGVSGADLIALTETIKADASAMGAAIAATA